MHPHDALGRKLLEEKVANFSDEEIKQAKLLLCQNIQAAYLSIEEMTKKLVEVEKEIHARRKNQ
jgi:hypothetical protein